MKFADPFDGTVRGRMMRVAAYTLWARDLYSPSSEGGRARLNNLTVAMDATSVGGRRLQLIVDATYDNQAVILWPQVTFLDAQNTKYVLLAAVLLRAAAASCATSVSVEAVSGRCL